MSRLSQLLDDLDLEYATLEDVLQDGYTDPKSNGTPQIRSRSRIHDLSYAIQHAIVTEGIRAVEQRAWRAVHGGKAQAPDPAIPALDLPPEVMYEITRDGRGWTARAPGMDLPDLRRAVQRKGYIVTSEIPNGHACATVSFREPRGSKITTPTP